jgi:hypothetical protein
MPCQSDLPLSIKLLGLEGLQIGAKSAVSSILLAVTSLHKLHISVSILCIQTHLTSATVSVTAVTIAESFGRVPATLSKVPNRIGKAHQPLVRTLTRSVERNVLHQRMKYFDRQLHGCWPTDVNETLFTTAWTESSGIVVSVWLLRTLTKHCNL